MFKSKEQIEIEFSKAINQAQELEDIARELSTIANAHIESAITLLEKSWRGENGTCFCTKGRELTAEMFETADDLIKVARNIRNTANIVYKAEKASLQIIY